MTKRILSIVAATILGLVSNAQAIPILGSVHVEDPSSLTARQATRSSMLTTLQTNHNLIGLSLTFEGDVFDLNLTFRRSFLLARWVERNDSGLG